MSSESRRKACVNCIRSKRRCGLEPPACKRCAEKLIPCTYPSVRLHPQPLSKQVDSADNKESVDASAALQPARQPLDPLEPLSLRFHQAFIIPNSWRILRTQCAKLTCRDVVIFKKLIQEIRSWLVTKGKNAFIHRNLYQDQLRAVFRMLSPPVPRISSETKPLKTCL